MKQILVVDDSPTMRRMVKASIGNLPGVTFIEAGSGLEAIEQLAIGPVGIIVLDLNMPDMHGIEVLRFVRKHQVYRTIPIIVLTTRGDEDMVRRGRVVNCREKNPVLKEHVRGTGGVLPEEWSAPCVAYRGTAVHCSGYDRDTSIGTTASRHEAAFDIPAWKTR